MRIHSAAIHYFDAVRRAGSIREAARRLNVASSAVNRQILKLEAEIGTPLFDRLPGGLKLTAAGEAMARHAIVVLQDLERARSDVDGLKGAQAGHIAVAAVEALCSAILPNAIEELRKRAPRVTVSVAMHGSFAIPALIASGEADVGVAFALTRSRELRQVAHGRFGLGAMMRPDHPLAKNVTIDLGSCLNHSVILSTPDLSINQLLYPALARLSRPMVPIVTANSIELMRRLAERGTGIAFQTRIGLERELMENRLVHIPLNADGPILADLGVYVRSERSLPATLDLFLQLLADQIQRELESENQLSRSQIDPLA